MKGLRKRTGLSQEKLAERLGVSRQAVTKWETDLGLPELENLRALASLFGCSLDELLSQEAARGAGEEGFRYESVTEYDIDQAKSFDMKLGGAQSLTLRGYEGEKLRVVLGSNSLKGLEREVKLKLDDIKNRIDVDVNRGNGITEAAVKEGMDIQAQLPNRYLKRLELSVHAEHVRLQTLDCAQVELNLKTRRLELDRVAGTVEIDCNLDMEILCHSLEGGLELNQVWATSRLWLPVGVSFFAVSRGVGTSIHYERDGEKGLSAGEGEHRIELNGIKSELVICTAGEE